MNYTFKHIQPKYLQGDIKLAMAFFHLLLLVCLAQNQGEYVQSMKDDREIYKMAESNFYYYALTTDYLLLCYSMSSQVKKDTPMMQQKAKQSKIAHLSVSYFLSLTSHQQLNIFHSLTLYQMCVCVFMLYLNQTETHTQKVK